MENEEKGEIGRHMRKKKRPWAKYHHMHQINHLKSW